MKQKQKKNNQREKQVISTHSYLMIMKFEFFHSCSGLRSLAFPCSFSRAFHHSPLFAFFVHLVGWWMALILIARFPLFSNAAIRHCIISRNFLKNRKNWHTSTERQQALHTSAHIQTLTQQFLQTKDIT